MNCRALVLLLICALVLAPEFTNARAFYYADEIDYRNNVGYALSHPFDNVDPDAVGDFDRYSCISLDDYNRFAAADQYDAYDELTSRTATRDDLSRLRRADQLKLIDEDPSDGLTRDSVDDYEDWNCYTLGDYDQLARQNQYDRREVVDFTDFDHLNEVKKIGKYRYNDFYAFPEDLSRFDLQHAVGRRPYYEPYDFRRSPYPLYGYGVRRVEDY